MLLPEFILSFNIYVPAPELSFQRYNGIWLNMPGYE
ncbi:MAG: hypothetical protein JWP81_3771 [Ferruginibacter sp.]|nr:hypothetical protein [Ferruginibacter sp.]